MKHSTLIILTLFLLTSCKKDETLMSGDISGSVVLVDHFWNVIDPEPGTEIVLYSYSEPVDSTVTDVYGSFKFQNLPYGRYDIYCIKPGYIRSWSHGSLFHVGGESPTEYSEYLYEIPDYQLELDTVTYIPEDFALLIPLKVDGDTILPVNSYSYMFRVFLSNSPDVSSENYKAIGRGYITDYGFDYTSKVASYALINIYNIDKFNEIKYQPIYIIVYPIANNQGYGYTDFLKGSLGPPSNVISFDWNQISDQ